MRLKTKEVDGVVIIELKGNLMGGPDSLKLRDTLHKLIERGKKNVVVDVKNVKFMNSAGLGTLIGGLTTMRNAGGNLKIANPTDKIQSLLVITRLLTVFETYDSVEEAIESFKNPRKKK